MTNWLDASGSFKPTAAQTRASARERWKPIESNIQKKIKGWTT